MQGDRLKDLLNQREGANLQPAGVQNEEFKQGDILYDDLPHEMSQREQEQYLNVPLSQMDAKDMDGFIPKDDRRFEKDDADQADNNSCKTAEPKLS